MRIDQNTGEIGLPEIGAAIGPSVSRNGFLATPAFQKASLAVRNEPWCSFNLTPIPLPETELHISVQFHGEQLTDLSLCHAAAIFGNSWAEWSDERELARKAFHESWLASELHLSPGHFPWGEIQSCYDAKGGSSFICIRYKTRHI